MIKSSPRLLPCLLTILLLSACSTDLEPTPIDPPNLLTLDSALMNGVTTGTITVTAEGAWSLSSPQEWVHFSPAWGIGERTVTIEADPKDLAPGDHSFQILLHDDAGELIDSSAGTLSFPDIVGQVEVDSSGQDSGIGGLFARPLSAAPLPHEPGRLIVGMDDRGDFQALSLAPLERAAGVSVAATIASAGVVVFEAADMASAAVELAGLPGVRYVEPDLPLKTLASNDPYRYRQWHLDTVRVDAAWAQAEIRGEGARIAIIDSGFDPDHPDLAGRVWETWDFGDGREDVFDPAGTCGHHGTHVAGIAAATADNLTGVAGVAPEASLVLLDIDVRGDCLIYTSDLLSAIEYVAGDDASGRRADVINVSLGCVSQSRCTYQQSMHDAIKRAHSAGVVMVAASGNESWDFVSYPAAYPEVIAVGATDENDQITYYSNRGLDLDVTAPGGLQVGIYSTYWTNGTGSNYAYMSGTSMAAPVVAGLAALIQSAAPSLNPNEVRAAIEQSAVDRGAAGWDEYYGHGRVDAAAAVELALSGGFEVNDDLFLRVDGGSLEPVSTESSFSVRNLAPGSYLLEVGSDSDGDGTIGGSGELYGSITVEVAWNSPSDTVTVVIAEQE